MTSIASGLRSLAGHGCPIDWFTSIYTQSCMQKKIRRNCLIWQVIYRRNSQPNVKIFQSFTIIKGVIQNSSYLHLTFISNPFSYRFWFSQLGCLSPEITVSLSQFCTQSIQAKWSWNSQITHPLPPIWSKEILSFT